VGGESGTREDPTRPREPDPHSQRTERDSESGEGDVGEMRFDLELLGVNVLSLKRTFTIDKNKKIELRLVISCYYNSMNKHQYLIFIGFLLMIILLNSQNLKANSVGGEIITVTRHFSKKSFELGSQYPRKLDPEGVAVITPGVELYYDQQLDSPKYSISFIRFTAAHYYDSMDKKAGYLHFGPRFEFFISEKIICVMGIGPTLYFRESWNQFQDYRDDGFFTESQDFMPGYQHKFLPGVDIDFQFTIIPDWQLVWSIIPGLPDIITNSFGIRTTL